MDIFQRTGIYHKMRNGDHGIESIQMPDFGSTIPEWQKDSGIRPTYKTPFE